MDNPSAMKYAVPGTAAKPANPEPTTIVIVVGLFLFFLTPASTLAGEPLFSWQRPTFFQQNLRQKTALPGSFGSTTMPVHWRTWFRGFGNLTSVASVGHYADLQTTALGFSGGVDRQIGKTFLVGLGVGTVDASMKGDARKEISHLSGYHFSGYARKTVGRLFFDGEIGLGQNEYKRPLFRDSQLQWSVKVETGTWWESGIAKVEPYLGLRYADLEDAENRNGKTTSLLGLRYSWRTEGPLAVTTPQCYLGWLHECGNRDFISVASFVDAPNMYIAKGYRMPRDRFYIGGGLTSSMGKSLNLYLRYTAEMTTNYASHTLLTGMNWNY